MSTHTKTSASKAAFFDEVRAFCDRVRDDDTVSHFFVIALHARGEQQDENGAVEAPASFLHNQLDTYTAAVMVNNISAGIALKELHESQNETRQ